MASTPEDVLNSAPTNCDDKQGKNCKQRVTNAYIVCVVCSDFHHKSCLQVLITRGKMCYSKR